MDWYRVLIGHEGMLRGHVVQRETSPRTSALVRAGFLAPLSGNDVVIPEQPTTYELEPVPAKVVKKSRGKQAKAGQGDGAESQPSSDVGARDEDDRADGGDGEGGRAGSSAE